MKKILVAAVMFVMLAGCTGANDPLDRGMTVRQQLLNAKGCSFEVTVTADYGSSFHTFTMDCQTDAMGNLTFAVLKPESIAGITGTVDAGGGKLTFDDQALAFELLADDQLSPVSAPWLLIRTMRSGYLTSAAEWEEGIRLAVDDSYAEDTLHLDIWINGEGKPVQAEVLFDGRRILSMEVRKFVCL